MVAQIDHPYVVNLRYAFQDDENCFFVLDLMLGGDLRCVYSSIYTCPPLITSLSVHIERRGFFEEHVVKFWMAELSEALEYLRSKRIVHRYVPRWLRRKYILTVRSVTSNRTTFSSTRRVMCTSQTSM